MPDTIISLIVLPNPVVPNGPLLFLCNNGGFWKNLSDANWRADADVNPDLTKVPGIIDEQLKVTMNLVGGGNLVTTTSLRNFFQSQYNTLVASEVQKLLQQAPDSKQGAKTVLQLHLHPRVDWIPWELLHDGNEFLGLRFVIARLPIFSEGLDLTASGVRAVKTVYNLLAANVLTPAEEVTWRSTFNGVVVPPATELQHPGVNKKDFHSIAQFEDNAVAADIIHLTCHGEVNTNEGVVWILDDTHQNTLDYRINRHSFSAMKLTQNPLIFGNACSTVVGAAGQGLLSSFGPIFLRRGAVNFVGTFAPVTQELAVGFAKIFYKKLLTDRLPMGEALLAAKLEYRKPGNPPLDPSFLFYCLYGSPETQFAV